MQLTDASALVTGGASGLGLATARELHDLGAHVVIADLASSNGKAIAEEWGARATFVPTDVTNADHVSSAIDVATDNRPLRVVVNCAGIASPARTVGKNGPVAIEQFTRIVEVNLIGTFNVIRLAAVRIGQAEEIGGERGVIVNTASVAAYDGQVGQAAYAASKGGVVAMTLPIARDLAGMKIRVVTIAPGLFRTPMFDVLSEEAIAALEASVPHPARLGDPVEYAALVAHIVANPMLNGEVIRLDGAIRLAAK